MAEISNVQQIVVVEEPRQIIEVTETSEVIVVEEPCQCIDLIIPCPIKKELSLEIETKVPKSLEDLHQLSKEDLEDKSIREVSKIYIDAQGESCSTTIDDIVQVSSNVFNAKTHHDFPLIGKENVVYKAETEKLLYQWNTTTHKYDIIGGDVNDIAQNIVNVHNTSKDAHNDIRLFIQEVSNRLNALANSDDETLDQMKEVVDYITDNRDLIEQITTNKISYTDIIDNLVTNVSNKPLSAAQGVVLKGLLDTLSSNKLDSSALPDAINKALKEAKESGAFDGTSVTVVSDQELNDGCIFALDLCKEGYIGEKATLTGFSFTAGEMSLAINNKSYTALSGKWLYNEVVSAATCPDYSMIVYDKRFRGVFTTNSYGAAIVLDTYGRLIKIYDGANIGYYTEEGKASTAGFTAANYATVAFSNLKDGELLIIFPNDGGSNQARGFALGLRFDGSIGKIATLTNFEFDAYDETLAINNKSYTAIHGKWVYNTEVTTANSSKYGMIIYDRGYTGTFATNSYGVAIILNERGRLIKLYDGANVGYYTEEGKVGSAHFTTANYATVAFSDLREGELLIIFPNDGGTNTARNFALGLRSDGSIGQIATLTGFSFDAGTKTLTIKDKSFEAQPNDWLYNTDIPSDNAEAYSLIIFDKNYEGNFKTGSRGMSIVLDARGKLIKIYDGVNIKYYTEEGLSETAQFSEDNFATVAFSELKEEELLVIFPNDCRYNLVTFSDGYTIKLKNGQVPVKGEDYFTDEDVKEIVSEVAKVVDLSEYQTKEDKTLATESKQIVGAINELNTKSKESVRTATAGSGLKVSVKDSNLHIEFDEYEGEIIFDCGDAKEYATPGLYDSKGNIATSWDRLVRDYGTDVTIDYTINDYSKVSTHIYNVLNNTMYRSVVDVVLPNFVTRIGDYAFHHCSRLTNITIPNSVTSIGNYAFPNCTELTSITIPDSITSIGNNAFSVCTKLTSITIPDSVTSIGNNAFYMCSYLKSIKLPNSLTSINSSMFEGCSNLDNIAIPDSVTSIGTYAFSSCTSLTNITIPESVSIISNQAFYNCRSLISINIPNSVTSIGNYAFCWCSSLESITIPNTVNRINQYTFSYCKALRTVNIPTSVKNIDTNAFSNCISLDSINYNGTVSQWKSIILGSKWNDSTGEYVIHCTNGDIAKDGTVTYK